MKKLLRYITVLTLIPLFIYTCGMLPTGSEDEDSSGGNLQVPVVESPIAIDSSAVQDLEKGKPVIASVDGKDVTITLLQSSTAGNDAGEKVITLETGEDTITYFKRASSSSKRNTAAAVASDSLTGTWHAFKQSVNDTIYEIRGSEENYIELVITDDSDGGIEFEMSVIGNPETIATGTVNRSPYFLEDSASMSEIMYGLENGKNYQFHIAAADSDSAAQIFVRFMWERLDTSLNGVDWRNDSLIWHIERIRSIMDENGNDIMIADTGFFQFSAEVQDENGGADTLTWTAYVKPSLFYYDSMVMSNLAHFSSFEHKNKLVIKGFGPDADNLTYTLLSGPDSLKLSDDTLIWDTELSDTGTFSASLQAEDSRGEKDTVDFIVTVWYDSGMNGAPFFNTHLNMGCQTDCAETTYVDSPYTKLIEVWDEDFMGFGLQLSLLDSIDGISFTGDTVFKDTSGLVHRWKQIDTLSWAATIDDTGSHYIRFMATDGAGLSDTLEWTIVVLDTNHAPIFVTEAEDMLDTVIVGDTNYDTITWTDHENDSCYLYISSSVSMQIIDDSIWTISPTYMDTGLCTCTVVLHQALYYGTLTDTIQWVLAIVDSNHAPAFAGRLQVIDPETQLPVPGAYHYYPDTAYTGETYLDTLRATDPNSGDALTFSFVDSISGMRLVSDSIISWTPEKSHLGTADTITMRVSDGRGKSSTVFREIKVFIGMETVGSVQIDSTPASIAKSGDYVYIAARGGGLHIIDVSDPTDPALTGSYAPGDYIGEVDVSGNYAYVLAGSSLVAVDISTPASPAATGSYSEGLWYISPFDKIALTEDYLYMAKGYMGDSLVAFDVSDPGSPASVYSIGAKVSGNDMKVSGNYLYAVETGTSGNGDLMVLDISTPELPSVSGRIEIYQRSGSVDIAGNYAYVCGDQTLSIVNISTPATPVMAGSLYVGSARDVSVSGDFAYIAGGIRSDGVAVIDITSPATPVAVGEFEPSSGQVIDAIVSGNYIYVATGAENALEIIRIRTP